LITRRVEGGRGRSAFADLTSFRLPEVMTVTLGKARIDRSAISIPEYPFRNQ
jgi:hypothetical protein